MINNGNNSNLVSIIIPAYNAELFVGEAIRSCIQQTYQLIEVIVVDDGSNDKTRSIVESFQNDPRVIYHFQDNAGVSAARNKGATIAKGDYLCFLDADDLFLSDNIQHKLNVLINNPDLGLVHADVQMMDEKGNLLDEFNKGLSGENRYIDLLLWKECVVPAPSSIMVKRDVFDRVGRWDTDFSTAADQDFFIRVTFAYPILRIDKVLTLYRIVKNSMGKNIQMFERDHIGVYNKMRAKKIFPDRKAERLAFSNLYLIIASSWWVHHKQLFKSVKYLLLSMINSYKPLLNKITR